MPITIPRKLPQSHKSLELKKLSSGTRIWIAMKLKIEVLVFSGRYLVVVTFRDSFDGKTHFPENVLNRERVENCPVGTVRR